MGHPMRLELTLAGLLVKLANHYTIRGALVPSCKCLQEKKRKAAEAAVVSTLPVFVYVEPMRVPPQRLLDTFVWQSYLRVELFIY